MSLEINTSEMLNEALKEIQDEQPKEEVSTIEDMYEPYLIQEGFLKRTTRGRMVTDKTYKYLHIEDNLLKY